MGNLNSEYNSLAKIGGWKYNKTDQKLFYSKEIYEILESDDYFEPTIEKATNFYIPEHHKIFKDAVRKIIEEAIPYDLDLKIITAKGNTKWVNIKGKILENSPIIIGVFQDISDYILENQALDLIAQVSTKLLEADINTFDYKILTNTINSISGAEYSALNVYSSEKNYTFSTIAVSGKAEGIKKAEALLGKSIIGLKWKFDQKRENALENKIITKFESISALIQQVLTPEIVELIEQQFEIQNVYVIKIYRNTSAIGDFTLFFKQNKSIRNTKLVETFSNQAGLVIEKIRAEEELLNNELKQKQMISGISDVIIIIDSNGEIKYISPNVSRILGWMTEDVYNKAFDWFVHNNDLSEIRKAFENTLIETGIPQPIELRLKHKNGDYRTVELIGTNLTNDPVIQGILVNFHDITQRKKIEAEALKLKQAIEHSSATILITDPKANIEYVNPKFTERTGYSFDEVLGKNPRILQSGQTPPEFYKQMWNTIVSGKEWKGEMLNKTKNGELFWEMASISSIKDSDNKITHYVAVKEDITASKIQQKSIKLKNLELERINAEKDKFFSIIAHDLRGPLSAMLGLSEIMSELIHTMTKEEIKELADNLKKSTSNIFDLLSNLLEWSTMQRGLIDYNPTQTTANILVSGCCDSLKSMADNKKIKLNINVLTQKTIFADINMLRTIMRNLVTNAIKFSNPNSKIDIDIRSSDNSTLFSVSDEGIGIPTSLKEKLFKIDEKVNRNGTNNEPSTGLGLLLCKDMVEKHRGKIWVESEENKGTTFFFTIPDSQISTAKPINKF
ncbi:MAG TPA: PAS domain S-box protein [Prolixibacteraceae bacterium]|nr:PAS domain S-box protein [Prolixibacteraceae bacterium]